MDFSTWSPVHTIFLCVFVLGFIGQLATLLHQTAKLEKRMVTQYDELRRQRQRLDKRFDEVITEFQEIRFEIIDLLTEIQS